MSIPSVQCIDNSNGLWVLMHTDWAYKVTASKVLSTRKIPFSIVRSPRTEAGPIIFTLLLCVYVHMCVYVCAHACPCMCRGQRSTLGVCCLSPYFSEMGGGCWF